MTSILSRLLTGGVARGPPPKRITSASPNPKAVRFGRVPKREKAKILAAMQKSNAAGSIDKILEDELCDEVKVYHRIIEAHQDTCAYTRDKVAALIQRARARPIYTQGTTPWTCPLNPGTQTSDTNGHIMEEFSERFSPAILGVVEFAKRIPGFMSLLHEDQVTLLKGGVFEVLLVRLACMFDCATNSLICLNGQILRKDSVQHSSNNNSFLLESMFRFAETINKLNLTDNEIALFSSVVIVSNDRPGVRQKNNVQKIIDALTRILKRALANNHLENPDIYETLMERVHDLKTLNALHSEKLLAYNTDNPNQQPSILGFNPVNICKDWSRYSMKTHDEEIRSPSSPSQQSQHSAGFPSEWSTESQGSHDIYGSPQSIGSNDETKSPTRSSSFSSNRSTEVNWQADMITKSEYLCPKIEPTTVEHCSGSGDELYYSEKSMLYPRITRVDSPTDSGIESGKEHLSITPTASDCSSPRSAMEEKVKDIDSETADKQDHTDDMPVLKRALQAPPLINTNMLMDEAYRNHKKFRISRREPEIPTVSRSLATSHSTLIKTLEQAPRYLSEQQLKRTDLIHNIIMKTEATNGQVPNEVVNPNSDQSHMNTNTTSSYVYAISHSSPSNVSPSQSTKSMMCPQGYYIPPSSNSYTTSSSPSNSSWPFAIPSTVATSPVRSPYRVSESHQMELDTPHEVINRSSPQQQPQRYYYEHPNSQLVIKAEQSTRLVSPSHSPSLVHQTTTTFRGQTLEAQPLNLSKKPKLEQI